MSELLSCPFCGGEAIEKRTGAAYSSKYEVVCTKCGCKTFKTVASPSHINAWNTRHRETCRIVQSEPDGQMWVFRHEFSCGCGQRNLFTSDSKPPNYCPNCGAKVVSE